MAYKRHLISSLKILFRVLSIFEKFISSGKINYKKLQILKLDFRVIGFVLTRLTAYALMTLKRVIFEMGQIGQEFDKFVC